MELRELKSFIIIRLCYSETLNGVLLPNTVGNNVPISCDLTELSVIMRVAQHTCFSAMPSCQALEDKSFNARSHHKKAIQGQAANHSCKTGNLFSSKTVSRNLLHNGSINSYKENGEIAHKV
jgi:hypothetical protein